MSTRILTHHSVRRRYPPAIEKGKLRKRQPGGLCKSCGQFSTGQMLLGPQARIPQEKESQGPISVWSRDGAAGLPQAHFSNNSNNKNPNHALFQQNSPHYSICIVYLPGLRETAPTAPTTTAKASFPPQERFSKFRYRSPVTGSIMMGSVRMTHGETAATANRS